MDLIRWIAAALAASLLLGVCVVGSLYLAGVARNPLHPAGGLQAWLDAGALWLVQCVGSILLWTFLVRISPSLERSRTRAFALFPICVAAVAFGFLAVTGSTLIWAASWPAAALALLGLVAFSWSVLGARYLVEHPPSGDPL